MQVRRTRRIRQPSRATRCGQHALTGRHRGQLLRVRLGELSLALITRAGGSSQLLGEALPLVPEVLQLHGVRGQGAGAQGEGAGQGEKAGAGGGRRSEAGLGKQWTGKQWTAAVASCPIGTLPWASASEGINDP